MYYTREQIIGCVAQGWTTEKNERKVMDPDLAEAIVSNFEKMQEQTIADLNRFNPPAKTFRDDLGKIINKWGIDNQSNMRDFLLAEVADKLLRSIIEANARQRKLEGK